MMDVQVSCRKCGKKAPASEFTVDNELKIAICKACANERKIAKSSPGFNPSVRNVPHELPKSAPRNPIMNSLGSNQAVTNSPSQNSQSSGSRSPLGFSVAKPAGWDETDELLEKAAVSKSASNAPDGNVRTADGRILHSCSKCKYQFKYDPEDDKPNKCPYCGTATKPAFRK